MARTVTLPQLTVDNTPGDIQKCVSNVINLEKQDPALLSKAPVYLITDVLVSPVSGCLLAVVAGLWFYPFARKTETLSLLYCTVHKMICCLTLKLTGHTDYGSLLPGNPTQNIV